jgi:glycosyltransferase involved in cell wall biosynthesis
MNSAPGASADAPLVSIVIPVFNGARYLAEAIDSALAQSHQNIEVIVVDDGSDDGGATAAICEDYGDQIRYFRKPNGGVASALNFGISKMSGSYFSWLSHDDRYLPDKVRMQLEMVLEHPEPVVVFGDAFVINPDGKRRWQTRLGERWRPEFDPRWLALEGRLSGCTLLIPRVCFEQCGMFDEGRPTVQDLELWYRIGSRYRFVFCPVAVVESRVHPDQGSAIDWHKDEAALTLIDLFKRSMGEGSALRSDDTPGTTTYRFWRHNIRGAYPGLRRFCERLRLQGRQRCRVVVADAGADEPGRVAGSLVDAGFREVSVVGRTLTRSTIGPTAPDDAPGSFGSPPYRDLSADLSELAGDEIVVLGFGDGASLDSLAAEIDRVVGREADAVIWPASGGKESRLAARTSALRAALDRLGGTDTLGLPQELAMVGSTALYRAPPPTHPGKAAAASRLASEAPSPGAEPRIVEATPPPAIVLAGSEAAADPQVFGAVPQIVAESRPRPGTERVRRLLSKPAVGRAVVSLAMGLHRYGPNRLSRRAVTGVEWIYCARGRIDPSWYILSYPEVRAAGWHPSLHYLSRGWREGKDPSSRFSTTLNAAYLPAPGYLNPLTRSAFAGRSFVAGYSGSIPTPPASAMPETDTTPPGDGRPEGATSAVAASAAPAAPRLAATEPKQRALLILSDGSPDAEAWSRALAQAARRRTLVWRATLRDGAVRGAVDALGNMLDLSAQGMIRVEGASIPLSELVGRLKIIGSVREQDVDVLLSSGQVPYHMLPLSLSDVEERGDLLRRAARIFAPSRAAKHIVDERLGGDAILMRPPDFAAAVRFPVSAFEIAPGEAVRVLAVAGAMSSADVIGEVARRLRRDRVEMVGTGPGSHRALPWSTDMQIIDMVGALDPHLIWLHADADFCAPCALVDVLRMGRPTIVSGAAVNWEGLSGRARSWNMTEHDPSAIATLIRGLAAGNSAAPKGPAGGEDASLDRLPIEELLS